MAQRRLLHVDRDSGFCARVRMVAEECDFEVCTINDPHEFHSTYLRFQPDLIALEIVMPGIDGLELLAWLSEQHCSAPVLVLTGESELYLRAAELLGQLRRGLSVHAFAKPITDRTLRTIFDDIGGSVLHPDIPHSKALPSNGPHGNVAGIAAIGRQSAANCAPGSV